MKINLTLFLFFFVFLVSSAKSQNLFNKRYGTLHQDYGTAICSTTDGGFAITGTTFGSGAGGDIFLMKLNSQGVLQWTKNIFGVNNDRAVAIYQLANGNFVIGGQTYSYGTGCTSAIAVMLDSTGNIIWSHTYGDVNCNAVWGFSQTTNGGYIGCGVPIGGTGPGWLFRTDANGNLQWSKSYQMGSIESVKQTHDGGFLAVNRQAGISLLKVDSSGNLLWHKTYIGSTGNTQSFYLEVLEDGSALITGEVYYNAFGAEPDIFLLKVDPNGERIWFKTYGFTFMEYGLCVKKTLDDGFIITGKTNSFGHGDNDAFLLKTDDNGDLVWAKTYGGIWYDDAIQVEVLPDSGFAFAGCSFSNSIWQDSSYVYVVRTDMNGTTSCNSMDWAALEQTQVYDPIADTITFTDVCIDSICYPSVLDLQFAENDLCFQNGVEEIENDISMLVYPNPVLDEITILSDGVTKHNEVNLYDVMGKKIYSDEFSGKLKTINCKLNSGVYFIQVTTENGIWRGKVIKE